MALCGTDAGPELTRNISFSPNNSLANTKKLSATKLRKALKAKETIKADKRKKLDNAISKEQKLLRFAQRIKFLALAATTSYIAQTRESRSNLFCLYHGQAGFERARRAAHQINQATSANAIFQALRSTLEDMSSFNSGSYCAHLHSTLVETLPAENTTTHYNDIHNDTKTKYTSHMGNDGVEEAAFARESSGSTFSNYSEQQFRGLYSTLDTNKQEDTTLYSEKTTIGEFLRSHSCFAESSRRVRNTALQGRLTALINNTATGVVRSS